MPVLFITTDVDVDSGALGRLAGIAGNALEVPAERVMVLAVPAKASLGGNCQGAVLVELRCARVLDVDATRNLVQSMVKEVVHSLGVEETRIYVQVESRSADALWRSVGGSALHAGERA